MPPSAGTAVSLPYSRLQRFQVGRLPIALGRDAEGVRAREHVRDGRADRVDAEGRRQVNGCRLKDAAAARIASAVRRNIVDVAAEHNERRRSDDNDDLQKNDLAGVDADGIRVSADRARCERSCADLAVTRPNRALVAIDEVAGRVRR
jgi:hypothetical protein